MADTGELIFYTRTAYTNPRAVLRSLINLVEAERARIVCRSKVPDREWQDFLRRGPGTPFEMLADSVEPMAMVESYRDGLWLSGEMFGSPMARYVRRAIAAKIPREIRGDHVPTDLILRIGEHDIVECAEVEEGRLVARAFLSVTFFGYHAAQAWQAYRERVSEIEEVQAVREELESLAGPLEEEVVWNV